MNIELIIESSQDEVYVQESPTQVQMESIAKKTWRTGNLIVEEEILIISV